MERAQDYLREKQNEEAGGDAKPHADEPP